MKDFYIKKYWKEEDTWFYLHFQNGVAVRQMEISGPSKIRLSIENPTQGEAKLYDQDIGELELSEKDFISKNEFENIWDN